MVFALVGNQNCGKTTLFNALTGSNQHVGNFPGVTVDQKMGEIRDEKGCSVVDLPGIYSLRPYTQEALVSRDFIINQKPVSDPSAFRAAGAHGAGPEHDGRGPGQRRLHRRAENEPGAGDPRDPHHGGQGRGRQRAGGSGVDCGPRKGPAQGDGLLFGRLCRTPLYSRRGAPHRGPCRPYRRSRPVLRRQAHRGRRRSGGPAEAG